MDPTTLLNINLLLSIEFAILYTLIWLNQDEKQMPWLWVAAEWLFMIAFVACMLFFASADLVWVVVAIMITWTSYALHLEALHRFCRTKSYTKIYLIAGALCITLLGVQTLRQVGLLALAPLVCAFFFTSMLIVTVAQYRCLVNNRYPIFYFLFGFTFLHALFFLVMGIISINPTWIPVLDVQFLEGVLLLELLITMVTGDVSVIGLVMQRLQGRLNYLAYHDELTELPNRRYFSGLTARELAECKRKGQPCAMFMIDIDHFKGINDRYGHPAGDRALFLLSAWLRRNLRQHDVLARLGGEEFAVFLPDTDEAAALEVAERLRASVQASEVIWEADRFYITISIGVSFSLQSKLAFNALLNTADQALYDAKMQGRNRIVAAAMHQASGLE